MFHKGNLGHLAGGGGKIGQYVYWAGTCVWYIFSVTPPMPPYVLVDFVVFPVLKFLYVIRDLVGNKNNSIANCIFYLTKKSNQPEDGS